MAANDRRAGPRDDRLMEKKSVKEGGFLFRVVRCER